MRKSTASPLLFVLCATVLAGSARATSAQHMAQAIPDAPQPQPLAAPGAASDIPEQTKRILGIFPNFRAVSTQTHLPAQSAKEKFVTASQDSFDYSAFVLPVLLAGYGQATNQTPEFHQGAAGFGRYFWHSFADQTDENYWVEFIVPAVTHEDTRFYTLGRSGGGVFKRAGYALSRAVITRSDAGNSTFNFGEVVGAGAAAGISSLYYPSRERSVSNTTDLWLTNIGIDSVTFVLREFWPDINQALFHSKQGPGNVTR